MNEWFGASYLKFAQALLDQRRDEACRAFDVAEAHGADPDRCGCGRWMSHMLLGNFEAAWRESDAIRERGAPDPHRMWDGKPLNGRRVIVRCLHGFGDAVQFLRYTPRLRSITSELTIEVPPAMLRIVRYFDGVGHAVTWGKRVSSASVAWDAQVEITELPYIFRTGVQHLPITERYLRLPRSHQCRVRRIMGQPERMRVGVVWAAGEWDRSRSIPFSVFEPLLSEPGCEYWNLQGGEGHEDWTRLPSSRNYRDICEIGDGLVNLAATICELDLVITVDTLAAHLAGALGKPAWVLLQHAADWRWMARGDRSPWYPSLRLYRQPSSGHWSELIQRVQQELNEWTQQSTRKEHIA